MNFEKQNKLENINSNQIIDFDIPDISEYKIEIYTLSNCSWCKKAKSILTSYGASVIEYQLDDANIIKQTEKLLDESKTAEDHDNLLNIFMFLNENKIVQENIETLLNGGKIEDQVQFVLSDTTISYLKNHNEVLPALNYFLDAENEKRHIIDNFKQFQQESHIGNSVPQIIVDGKYFGSYADLTNCIKNNDDLEHCLFNFESNFYNI